MSTLQATTIPLDLKPAKPVGLAALGVPAGADTAVRKGKLGEAMQRLDDGRIGRRWQNLRATLVSATEAGTPVAQLILQFELFGDDCAPQQAPAALAVRLLAGEKLLAELPLGRPCLPFAACWYEQLMATPVAPAQAAAADRLELVAAAEPVRVLAGAATAA